MTLLRIPQHCHRDWNAMAAVERGRHCATCSTTVVDLTSMPRPEAERFITRMESGDLRGEHVCVKARVDRSGRLLASSSKRRLLTNGLALVLGMSLAGCHDQRMGTVGQPDGPTRLPPPSDAPEMPVMGTVQHVDDVPRTGPVSPTSPEAPMPTNPKPPSSATPPDPNAAASAAPADVGSATVAADGTLNLMLRSAAGDGTIAEALLVVTPTDPRYPAMLKHLGNPKPGESCKIPPFPESTIDPDTVK